MPASQPLSYPGGLALCPFVAGGTIFCCLLSPSIHNKYFYVFLGLCADTFVALLALSALSALSVIFVFYCCC